MMVVLRRMWRAGYGGDACFVFFPTDGQTITQVEDPVECRIEYIGEVFRAHRNWRLVILERTRNGG